MTTTVGDKPGYVLGHSDEELQRLERQGAFLRAPTRSLFYRAGIVPGMRVLDFGCGVGDVALLTAEMVGPTGEVVGVDRAPDAVELARARAASKHLENVRFECCDENGIEAVAGGRKFDAVVGRLVLVHQSDTTAIVRRLASFVRPGGVVAFHEMDLDAGHWTSHPNPLLEQLWRWVDGIVGRGIFPGNMSRRLHEAFDHIGIVDRLVMREGRLVRATDPAANAWIAGFMRTITQPVQKMGLGHEDDLPVEVLLQHIHAEPTSAEALNVPVHMVGATGTIPHPPAHLP